MVPWQILEDDLDLHQDEDQDPLGMSYVQFVSIHVLLGVNVDILIVYYE